MLRHFYQTVHTVYFHSHLIEKFTGIPSWRDRTFSDWEGRKEGTIYCSLLCRATGPMFSCFLSSLPLLFLRQCLVPTCIISLLLANTVSPVRPCLSISLKRFRGTQKEDVGLSSGGGGGSIKFQSTKDSMSSLQQCNTAVKQCYLYELPKQLTIIYQ